MAKKVVPESAPTQPLDERILVKNTGSTKVSFLYHDIEVTLSAGESMQFLTEADRSKFLAVAQQISNHIISV